MFRIASHRSKRRRPKGTQERALTGSAAAPSHRQTRLLLEGYAYLGVLVVVLVAALIRDINLLMVLFSMLLGMLLLNWRFAIVTIRDLEVSRSVPGRVSAGDPFEVDIELASRQRRGGSWVVQAVDTFTRVEPSRALPPITARVMVPRIPADTVVRATYRGRLVERGKYQLDTLRVSTRFPLGFVEHRLTYRHRDTLIVLPRLGRLTSLWLRRQRDATLGSREAERQQGLLEGEFHGLRDWHTGDSRRWIHWRTTARQNKLMVRQFEKQGNQDLVLLIDLWQPRKPNPQQSEAVEQAVSAAATIVHDACRRGGGQLILGIAGRQRLLTRAPASMALVYNVLEAMAVVEPTSDDLLPRLLDEALDEVRKGTNRVIVSTRPCDLTDTERFERVWNDPWKRPWLSGALCLDASNATFRDYFEST